MIKKLPTEHEEQKKLIQWLRIKKIFHFANTNENNTFKQDRKYAMIAEAKAKAAGKLKGVADLTVFLPNKILFIELKRSRKTLKSGKLSVSHTNTSPEQLKFLETVNTFVYAVGMVCYGYIEAKTFIENEINQID